MLILLVAAFLVLVPQVAHSDCIDYGDYIHRLGSLDTPGSEEEVAISGTKGYVVNGVSGLHVIDLSNPASPVLLGSLDTPGQAYDVVISGALAYVADDISGLQVVDISNPASPMVVGTVDTPGNARGIAVSGSLAYVADGYEGVQVIDISNPAAPAIVGTVDTPNFAFDLALSGNTAYVADNNSGLQVIDASNPMAPMILGSVDTPGFARKVALYGTMALVADDNALAIIDVSNPLSPVIIQRMLGFSFIYDVEVSGGVAYLATNWYDLVALDMANPASPSYLGSVDTRGTAWAVAVSSGMACVPIRSTSGPEQFSGLEVIDVSNPASPPILGQLSGNQSVTIDGTKAYTTGRYRIGTSNNFESKLYVFDVSNPHSPVTLGFVVTPGFIDGVAVSGTKAYVADGALRVIDVSNPSSPLIVGSATAGNAVDVGVNGTKAYVAGGAAGLFVVDVSNPSAPVIVGSVDTPDNAWAIDVSSSLACVADRSSGLQVIDISNPLSPHILGSVDTPGNAMDVAISGSLAFVTDDDPDAGFQVIDLSNPSSPSILATLDMPDIANGIAVSGPLAYVADGTFNLQVVDVFNPSSPMIIGRGPEAGNISRKIATSGQIVCMTDTGPGSNPLLILPSQCFNAFPVVQNPGNQNGSELKYFSVTVTASDVEGDPLTMSLVGPPPAWATFIDVGSGTALLRGTPQSGQAGTYPVSIRASDGHGMATVSFNIAIAGSQATVNLEASGFVPGSVSIPAGGQLTWVKIAGGNHTTTNGTGPLDPAAGTLWDAQLRSTSPQFIRVFPTGGTFPYFCRNHPSETGTITVSSARVGVDETVWPRFRLVVAPNPFRAAIDLHFDLERAGHVRVIIMDLQGRKVRELVTDEFPAGTHRVTWEGQDDHHAPVGPGLYFARLTTGDGYVQVQKLFKIR